MSTLTRTSWGSARAANPRNPLINRDLHAATPRHAPCYVEALEVVMSVMVEISAAVAGMAIGFGAARLFLGGLLAVAFKGR